MGRRGDEDWTNRPPIRPPWTVAPRRGTLGRRPVRVRRPPGPWTQRRAHRVAVADVATLALLAVFVALLLVLLT